MKTDSLIAIDVHTYAEVSCRQPHDEAWHRPTLIFQFESDQPCGQGCRIELSDDRLDIGEATRERMHWGNVAAANQSQGYGAEKIRLGPPSPITPIRQHGRQDRAKFVDA
jgi:hypothetical protein